jgi:DNA-binding PadR family transcriptional regulator
MREPTFLILTALADEPRHGYGIVQEVRVLSGGPVTLLTGALYTALYRLTAEGLVSLTAETARLRQLTTAAEARLRSVRPKTA